MISDSQLHQKAPTKGVFEGKLKPTGFKKNTSISSRAVTAGFPALEDAAKRCKPGRPRLNANQLGGLKGGGMFAGCLGKGGKQQAV